MKSYTYTATQEFTDMYVMEYIPFKSKDAKNNVIVDNNQIISVSPNMIIRWCKNRMVSINNIGILHTFEPTQKLMFGVYLFEVISVTDKAIRVCVDNSSWIHKAKKYFWIPKSAIKVYKREINNGNNHYNINISDWFIKQNKL